jgi:hypothetical protein
VADIIIAVDEPLDATQCGGKENCHGADAASGTRCMTHELWATLNAKMVDYPRFGHPAGPGRAAAERAEGTERGGDAPPRAVRTEATNSILNGVN